MWQCVSHTCTESRCTSIWGVVRHYLFTVLDAALSLAHVAMYLTCTCTDSTPIGGVLKSYCTISQSWMAALWYRTCTSALPASVCMCVCVEVLVRSAYIHCRSTSTGGVFEHSHCYCSATTQRYVPSTCIYMYAEMYMLIVSLLSSLSYV